MSEFIETIVAIIMSVVALIIPAGSTAEPQELEPAGQIQVTTAQELEDCLDFRPHWFTETVADMADEVVFCQP